MGFRVFKEGNEIDSIPPPQAIRCAMMSDVQLNLLIRTLSGQVILSFVERLSSFRFSIECVYMSTFDLSFIGKSFGVSFIKGLNSLSALCPPPQ